MLQLVTGLAGTGKSTWLLQQLAVRTAAGRPALLLVPEQFSSSAEGLVWQKLGEVDSGFVEVLSFRTLSERILKASGGLGIPVLGDAGRVVMVRRALDAVAGQLHAFARQRRSTAFAGLCAQTLHELKTAGASPSVLLAVAKAEQNDKFEELALIFDAYETLLAKSAMDPQDLLDVAGARAGEGYLVGKALFVDSFDGFTAPEYRMLAQLLAHCEAVTVALCCGGLSATEESGVSSVEELGVSELFTPVRRTARRLAEIAARAQVQVAPPVHLRQLHRPQSPALAAVNTVLAGTGGQGDGSRGQGDRGQGDGSGVLAYSTKSNTPEPSPCPLEPKTQVPSPCQQHAITFTPAADEWEELRLVAAEMRRLALAGVPFSRMALVCRDTALYRPVVERQLPLFDVPFFFDEPGSIEYTAPVAFLRAALGVLQRGLVSADILALLKTGLCGFAESEIYELENYVYTWQPRPAEWLKPFENHPGGLLLEMDEAARASLCAAERLRAAVAPVLDSFRQKAKNSTARGLSKALYRLMDHFAAAGHAEAQAALLAAQGEFALADQCRRAWDMTMDMLDTLASLLGEEHTNAQIYDELLLVLVRATDFGQAPQTLECAVFTGADRMRLQEPDYVFVLGLCEGEFPAEVGYSGLLTHNDRDALVRGGLEMPGSFENRCRLEEMFFYKALCAPARGLHLSYPLRHGGQARAQSAALQPVLDALSPPILVLDDADLAATPAAAYDRLSLEYRGNTQLAASLFAALEQRPQMGPRLALLQEVDNPGGFFVRDAALIKKLVGKPLTLSATTAERYFQCPFSYFMERVLRVRPRRRAELSPMESGTFVHYILEQVLAEAGAGFAVLTDEALLAMAERYADDFITRYLPDDTRRTARRLAQIKDTCAALVLFMRDAAAQSRFAIDALELPVGDEEGAVPPLEIETDAGHTVRVVGKIDRVDALQMEGKTYLCIVDYKTGNKDFHLDEVPSGTNIQMLVYMAALCENGSERYPGAAPAGVVYLGSDPSPRMDERGAGDGRPAFKLNGLFLSDSGVLDALDNRADGSFLPVRFNKDGTPSRQSPVADEAAFAETLGTVRGLLGQMADTVYDGQFPARPLVKGSARPCKWCAYRAVCRHEDGRNELDMNTVKKREVAE